MALPGVGACDISKISKEANEVQGVEGVTGRLGSYWKVRECMIAEIKVNRDVWEMMPLSDAQGPSFYIQKLATVPSLIMLNSCTQFYIFARFYCFQCCAMCLIQTP